MFNLESFDIKLETEFIGRIFFYIEEIESTNNELLTKKKDFPVSGTVMLAEKQIAGKGRKDRAWQSAKGQNLTFSIMLCDADHLDFNLNHMNFAASLAVANSIENLYQLPAELKWPNDVMISGKKVAGILTESSMKGMNTERVVTGIGINVNQNIFQGEFNYPPTSIRIETNLIAERESLLAEYLNLFEEYLLILKEKPDEILNDWRSRCKMIGDKITITDGDKMYSGIFFDIDENGYLLLKRNGRLEKIHFGDVSLS